MSEFADVGYWWLGRDSESAEGPPGRMHGRSLPVVLPCDDLKGNPRAWRKDYKLIIVHHLPRESGCIRKVRRHHPNAKIALRLDRAPEVLNKPGMLRHWPKMLQDMRGADFIACHMPDNRHARYWEQITGTKAIPLPSPILPHPDLDEMRNQKRENLIVCVEHRAGPRYTAPSLAAAAYVQKHTGCKVIMANVKDDHARKIADQIGLRAKLLPEVGHPALIALLARATLVIDLYTMHTPGRINTLAAWLGTPSVGSWNSPIVGHPSVDPFSASGGEIALALMVDPEAWKITRERGIETVDRMYAPEAIRDAVRDMMSEDTGS